MLEWPSLEAQRDWSSLLLFHKIHSGAVSIEKDKCLALAHSLKSTRASHNAQPGRVAQSVTCLATDACLNANPGVTTSIPVRSHTLVEIDHEMISTVILLPSADSFKKGCCQLQAKVCTRITG